MKLMIIESPNKREKLSKILGPGWDIRASYGHIRDLPNENYGLAPPLFKMNYEMRARADTIRGLKEAARKADEVYLATDPDREGESISWHLKEVLGLRNPKRVTFNEITEQAVKTAVANPRQIDDNLVFAQEGRRAIDRLVGWEASPVLWASGYKGMSAGRVQSPAVRLVVERDREIRKFKSTTHFGARIFFKDGWSADWDTKPFVSDEKPYMLDKQLANDVASVRDVVVSSFEDGTARKSPYPPFKTASLQMAGSVKLGFNPKKTMDLAQKLFEGGHITYHRTDNPNLSDESMSAVSSELRKMGIECVAKRRTFKAPEGAQAGHPAITPTHWEVASAGDTADERKLYELIRLQALACQAPDAQYATRKAVLDASAGAHKVRFLANGRTLTFKGWLAVVDGDATSSKEDQEAEPTNPVPVLAKGDAQHAEDGRLLEQKTKAPPKYTEATLIAKLEKEGVGRPSTYSAIMEGIVKREYVKISGKYLDATPRGEYVVDTLVGRCQFMDIPYTKSVEGQLDEVAAGKSKYEDVVRGMYDQLKKELSGVNAKVVAGLNSGPPPEVSAEFMCADPNCSKPLCRRPSKSGKGFWWGCTGFKEGCKNIYYDKDGKPDYEAAKQSQESGRSGSQRSNSGSGNSRSGKSSSRSSGKGSTRGADAYRAVTSRSGGRGR